MFVPVIGLVLAVLHSYMPELVYNSVRYCGNMVQPALVVVTETGFEVSVGECIAVLVDPTLVVDGYY